MAYQAMINNDVFNKLRFVNEKRTQILSQLGEEVRTHRVQDAALVIHGDNQRCLGLKWSRFAKREQTLCVKPDS